VHPKMTGLRAAPDKIRDRSLEFHPRCAQRNMPLESSPYRAPCTVLLVFALATRTFIP
jgi:hypothetical protein